MEMEQNTHSKNDIRYSFGCPSVREFTRRFALDPRDHAPINFHLGPHVVQHLGIEFQGEFHVTNFDRPTEGLLTRVAVKVSKEFCSG